MRNEIARGMKDAIPICAGYLAVGFTFGMAAVSAGLTMGGATLISFTNLTSAGQFAGLAVIAAGAPYFEMALTQLVINLRYALMSLSLSQKLDTSITRIQRCIIAFSITDEAVALVSTQEGKVGKYYIYGVMSVCIASWTCGTFFGAAASSALPVAVSSALGIAIYGMFLAIIIPPARKEHSIAAVILIAVVLSSALHWLPGLKSISPGFAIVICTILAASAGALIHPVEEEDNC